MFRSHKDELRCQGVHNIDVGHNQEFISWFEKRVGLSGETSIDLLELAQEHDLRVQTRNSWCVNGYKFRTYSSKKHLKTQNSGLVVKSKEVQESIIMVDC